VSSHPNRALLYTLIALMQVFWSANFLVGKAALREFPAPLLASLRVVLAGLIILPVILPIYAARTRGAGATVRRDLPMFALLALVGVAVNQFCFVIGLGLTSVAHSALIIGMAPIWVLLLGAWRGLERITARKLAGMLVALAGVAVLNLERASGPGPTVAGDLITAVAGICFAIYTIRGKEIQHRHGTFTVNAITFALGGLFLLPVAVWQGSTFRFAEVSAAGWMGALYMAVFPSLACYLIFYYALGYISPVRLSTLAYLQPVVATLGGALLLGERVSAALLAGGAIILGGVYLTERGR